MPLFGVIVLRSALREGLEQAGHGWWAALWLSLFWMVTFIVVAQWHHTSGRHDNSFPDHRNLRARPDEPECVFRLVGLLQPGRSELRAEERRANAGAVLTAPQR
ncbi:hypothetical protein [Ramlibacter sp. WS9]|uniref:hypothetical protein n=1 Tax=Ramlibacter sp. WS9 TaxID=1882741 RepID=UPI00116D8C50|nr:hypothetical protein [Ramlibacter sp. WS9]ROZ79837.1 hypothetical protein EEB15_02795 [Ramlibacter sp. WS9]